MVGLVAHLIAVASVTLADTFGDLALAAALAAGGTLALSIAIGLAMRGGAGFVDLDREGRFPVAILALASAGFLALVAIGVTLALIYLLVQG